MRCDGDCDTQTVVVREDENGTEGSHEYFYMTWGYFSLGFEIYSEYLELSSVWLFSKNDEVSLCFGLSATRVVMSSRAD